MIFAVPRRLALSLIALCLASGAASANEEHHAGGELEQARSIVHNLLKDNQSYVKGHKAAYFAPIIKGQQPRATIVTCSDSRVHTHALDKTPDGDLFMVRDIGNQLATAEGSVEYGVRHLHTPVLMFIGHSSCGAVKAAMGDTSKLEPAIRKELDTLKVAGGNADDDKAVMANVQSNVNKQVDAALAKFADAVKAGTLTVVGAVYDFRNDYKQGNGRLVLVNVNGATDAAAIKAAPVMRH
ncbi:MAG: carbonic anhydrase [Pseudomonadota bacterium]